MHLEKDLFIAGKLLLEATVEKFYMVWENVKGRKSVVLIADETCYLSCRICPALRWRYSEPTAPRLRETTFSSRLAMTVRDLGHRNCCTLLLLT